jgi:hypothetical protein
MPGADRIKVIAEWLGVRPAWLRDGEGDEFTSHQLREPTAPAYLDREAAEIARAWALLSPERKHWYRELLFREAVICKRCPWLNTGRARPETFDQFESRAAQNLDAMMQITTQTRKT